MDRHAIPPDRFDDLAALLHEPQLSQVWEAVGARSCFAEFTRAAPPSGKRVLMRRPAV